MFNLKRYNALKYRKRYGRYRRFFFLSMLFFLIFAVGEWILYGSGGRGVQILSVEWQNLFPPFFAGEAAFYLLAFLLGITVYAPFFQFASASLRGIFAAYLLSGITASFGQKGSVPLFLAVFIYILFSSALYFSYSAFCSMVSLRLFTDGTLGVYRAEEQRMFGGTLFNSTLFCNTVNLRFLSMYLLFFLLAFLLVGALTLSYVFFLSLV